MKSLVFAAAVTLALAGAAHAQGAKVGAARGAAEGDRVGGPAGAALGGAIGGMVGGAHAALGQPDPGPRAYGSNLPTRAGYVPPRRRHHRHHHRRM